MKPLRFSLAIIFAAGLSANAQTNATTDPVGFVSYTVKANSDQKVGIPMQQSSTFQGVAATVTTTVVTATGMPALTGSCFLIVTSGTATGLWEAITSSSSGSATLSAQIPGFVAGNNFAVKQFWTLGTLLPGGGNVPVSTDFYSPEGGAIFVYSPSQKGVNLSASESYFYFIGDADYAAGWYNANTAEPANNFVLTPECYLTIRNSSASPITVSFVGSVPTKTFAIDVVSTTQGNQDNLIYYPYPSSGTLDNANLASVITPSTDFYSPEGDALFLYNLDNQGVNPSASSSYFYFAGDADYAAGWYNANTSEPAGSTILSPGMAFVIRKNQTTSNSSLAWKAPLTYTLNP